MNRSQTFAHFRSFFDPQFWLLANWYRLAPTVIVATLCGICLQAETVLSQDSSSPESPDPRSHATLAQLPDADQNGEIVIRSALVTIAKTYELPVEQAGVLADVLVREGQVVRKGDVIAKLNDTEYRLELDRAKLEFQIATMAATSDVDVEFAQKSMEVAAADLTRSEQANLRVENSIPISRIEKQRLERDRTQLQLKKANQELRVAKWKAELAENNIRRAELQLSKTVIQSPVDGLIVSVANQKGEWVEPSQTLVRIVQVDRLKVEGFVPAKLSRKIKVGMPVQVRFENEWVNGPVAGKILFVDPEANPVNLNLQVWVEVDNEDGKLIPGMRGDIAVETK